MADCTQTALTCGGISGLSTLLQALDMTVNKLYYRKYSAGYLNIKFMPPTAGSAKLSRHCLRLAVLYGCQARGWAYLVNTSVNLRRGRVDKWGKFSQETPEKRAQASREKGCQRTSPLIVSLSFEFGLRVNVNQINWQWSLDDKEMPPDHRRSWMKQNISRSNSRAVRRSAHFSLFLACSQA